MKSSLNLEQMYHLYAEELYRYVLSLTHHEQTSEDIVQETFYRAYDYFDSFNSNEQFKPWLFKVAYHTFIDMYRKDRRLIHYDSHLVDQLYDHSSKSAEESYIEKDSIATWFKLLHSLPLTRRNAIILRDYYHFSYEEISKILVISLSKTKIEIHRGRKQMRDLLKDIEEVKS